MPNFPPYLLDHAGHSSTLYPIFHGITNPSGGTVWNTALHILHFHRGPRTSTLFTNCTWFTGS